MDPANALGWYRNNPRGIFGARYCDSCGFVVDIDLLEGVVSPVPHLAGKNHMPVTSNDYERIQQGIDAANGELELIEEELSRLARMERLLRERKQALKEFRDEHNRLTKFNPTHHLPKEVWMEIFFHNQAFLQSEALPQSLPKRKQARESSSKSIITSFDSTHGPLLLAGVCSTWQKIVLETAGLWSKIRVVLDTRHMVYHILDLLDLWHVRSREAALDIQLLLHSTPEYSPEAATTKTGVLQKLASQSHRWEKLYLIAPPSCISKGLWTIKYHLPALKKCIIHCPDDTGHSWLARELGEDIFAVAPRLETLILDNSSYLLKNMKFPYHQLTSLDVKRCLPHSSSDILTPNECILLLQQCPELRSCKLTCGYWGGRPILEYTHPTLQELRLYGATQGRVEFGYDGIGIFLDYFTAPLLQELSLDLRTPSSRKPSSWECSQLAGFLDRCHRLRHLSITTFEALDTPKELIEYLMACPIYIEFDFWVLDEIGEDLLDELEGYMHDESGELSWLPDKVYYSYIPNKPEHMVISTKCFFEDEDEVGGYVYRASQAEIIENWKYEHACSTTAFSYIRNEYWDKRKVLPPMLI